MGMWSCLGQEKRYGEEEGIMGRRGGGASGVNGRLLLESPSSFVAMAIFLPFQAAPVPSSLYRPQRRWRPRRVTAPDPCDGLRFPEAPGDACGLLQVRSGNDRRS